MVKTRKPSQECRQHRAWSVDQVSNLIELCAGVALSSIGFTRVGFRHCYSVEIQPLLGQFHQSVHDGVPVVIGDATHDAVACQILDHCSSPGTVMSGIACQPYSRGGLKQGEMDNRAQTLPGTLRLLHLLQAPILVLECAAPAASNAYALNHIKALQMQLNFHVVDCKLRLENVWTANRYRWWVIASFAGLGPVSIPVPPLGSKLTVRDLMPYTKQWSEQDEDQLLLTPVEVQRFGLGGVSMKSPVVKPDQKLPTALHSWAS